MPLQDFTNIKQRNRAATVLLFGFFTAASNASATGNSAAVDPDGRLHIEAFDLPESSYLSEETRAALRQVRALDAFKSAVGECPPMEKAAPSELPSIRKCQAKVFYKTEFYKSVRDRYPVLLVPQQIGGTNTEVFTPSQGIEKRNEDRVLINLHGGSFCCFARINSQLESIPIASLGRIKVISIDYRQAPEYIFPAASEDVESVYREVLKHYKPANVGLYGCSSGGALVAESIARFQTKKLPLPGAIGMFCFGAGRSLSANMDKFLRSDSGFISTAIFGDFQDPPEMNYFKDVDIRDPLVSPGDSDEVMSRFPPTLLISGTRDVALSSVLATHAQLVRLGVETDLHVWEGMGHAFHFFPEIPESRESYSVIVRFFDTHLGK